MGHSGAFGHGGRRGGADRVPGDGCGGAGVLHRQLLTDVDAAADRRVRDVVAGLQFDPPAELDTGLLATDSQIAVVQVIDSSGALVRASAGAPRDPLTDPALFGEVRTTVSTESEDGTDLRVSGAPADRQGTRYTVLVGADGTGVDSTVTIVAVLLAIAMPIVVTGAAAATFVLVRRSCAPLRPSACASPRSAPMTSPSGCRYRSTATRSPRWR